MEEYNITNGKGTSIKWTPINNGYYCILYQDDNQKYTFTPKLDLNCELFMIGGGGAGGYFFGGGGGAGAAYINKNYTFTNGNTYSFNIGNGGKCSIENINNLFTKGLTLKIFNNTNPALNTFQIKNDDYSTVNIDPYIKPTTYIVNNITINDELLQNSTTYIWDGYMKCTKTGMINFNIDSTYLKSFVWIDKYVYNDTNSFFSGYNNNRQITFDVQADVYYKIKIIVYSDNTRNKKKFSFNGDNCTFYNFNSSNEIYNYIKATDTIMSIVDTNNTLINNIRCIGGGNGGCGLINQNTDLDGGCGGGSGLNKIRGKSLALSSYNGFDGAVGAYLGGGGGISGEGFDSNGGDGVILKWFNDTIVFGAGGNGAGNTTSRHLGYGCGGNGNKCCYSKQSTTNNGMNGCVIIYVKSSSGIFEGFANNSNKDLPSGIEKFTLQDNPVAVSIPSYSIVGKLEEGSMNSLYKYNLIRYKTDFKNNDNFPFANLSLNNANLGPAAIDPSTGDLRTQDNFLQEMYLYDLMTITNIYTAAYNLLSIVTARDGLVSAGANLRNMRIEIPLTPNDSSTCTTQSANGASFYKLKLGFLNSSRYISNIYLNITSNIDNVSPLPQSSSKGDFNQYIKDNIFKRQWEPQSTAATNIMPIFINDSGTDIPIIDYINSKPQHLNITNATFPLYYGYKSRDLGSITNISGMRNFIGYIYNFNSTLSPATIPPMDYIRIRFYNNSANTAAVTTSNYPSPATGTDVPVHTNYDYSSKTYATSTFICYPNCSSGFSRGDITATYRRDETLMATSNNYNIQRAFLYHNAFYTILNDDSPNTLLQTLKAQIYKYNMLFYANLIHYDMFNFILNNPKLETPNITSPTIVKTLSAGDVQIDLDLLMNNIDTYATSLKDYSKVNIYLNDMENKLKDLEDLRPEYYEMQNNLNKIISRYNMLSTSYTQVVTNFKIFMVIALVIIIALIVIFTLDETYFDNNSKIIIYVIFFIVIIIAFYFYYNYELVEKFATTSSVLTTFSQQGPYNSNSNTQLYSLLSTFTQKLNNFNVIYVSNIVATPDQNVTDLSKSYIQYYTDTKLEKKEYYKKRFNSLDSAIQLLKKNINFYRSLTSLVIFMIILFILLLILYIAFPENTTVISLILAIPFIISICSTIYYLSRSTRMYENKKYWANMNPSDDIIKRL